MLGRIGLKDQAAQAEAAVQLEIRHPHTARGAECLPVGQGLADIVVARHCADPILLQPDERSRIPHACLARIGIVEIRDREGIQVHGRDAGWCRLVVNGEGGTGHGSAIRYWFFFRY